MNELQSYKTVKKASKILNTKINLRRGKTGQIERPRGSQDDENYPEPNQKITRKGQTAGRRRRQIPRSLPEFGRGARSNRGRKMAGQGRPVRDNGRNNKFYGGTRRGLNNIIKNKTFSRGNIGINKNEIRETGLPWMEISTKGYNRDGEECLLMTGSEYVTEISVYTTASPLATQPGDVIFTLPLSPRFYPGTRYKKMSTLFQKYRFKNLVFECIPVVPSIQAGALIGFINHDPAENYTIISDPDTKLRNYMAHHAAHMWNVYNYGTMRYEDDGTFDEYFTGPADEARLESQGTLLIAAASEYFPYNAASTLALAQIIMHYEVEFCVRKIEDDASSAAADLVIFPVDGLVSDALTSQEGGNPVSILNSFANTYFSFNGRDPDLIYIIYAVESFVVGLTVPTALVEVDTVLGLVNLFEHGSTWYGYWAHMDGNPNTKFVICATLEDALERVEDSVVINTSINPAYLCNCALNMRIYNMEMS